MIGLAKTAAGAGNLDLVERPMARPRGGEVRVDVHSTGICGGDLRLESSAVWFPVPMTLGHEIAGSVAEVGAGVDESWLGMRVVVDPLVVCGSCELCLSGMSNLCPSRLTIGVQLDGGFAASTIAPATNLHSAPDALSDAAASICEPLACVCHSLLDPSLVTAGSSVLVIGPGPMGNLAAQVARAEGGDVTLVGLPHDAARLELAASLGFITEPTEGQATYDVVIECSGSEGGIELALERARIGGVFVQIGMFGRPVTLAYDRFGERELGFRARFAATPLAWSRALGLVASGAVVLEPLVGAILPLSAWPEAFADLRSGRFVKAVLDPRLEVGGLS